MNNNGYNVYKFEESSFKFPAFQHGSELANCPTFLVANTLEHSCENYCEEV